MEKLFIDLPEQKKPILEKIIHFFEAFSTGKIDFTAEVWQPLESKGYRFLPDFRPETAAKFFEEVNIEDDTVFIASFPKTGTHWISEITRHILYGEDEKLSSLSKQIPAPFWLLETSKPEKVDLLEHLALPRKIFATHLPTELMDLEKIKKANAKIIVPIRNPKDQAISWFHFTKYSVFESVRHELNPEWSQFLLDYVHGKHRMITKPGEWYPEYLLGWYKHKDDDNVLFVHFEDLKKDPQDGIRRIAEFLGVKLTNDRVIDIAGATSFGSMKKAKEPGNGGPSNGKDSVKMFRKGEAGAWKNTFTVAQSELVDKIIEEKLGHTDIKFRYE